jgi:hypothetical protein
MSVLLDIFQRKLIFLPSSLFLVFKVYKDRELEALLEHVITFEKSFFCIDNKSQIKTKDIEKIQFLNLARDCLRNT